MATPLQLMLYDRTDRVLSLSWRAGGALFAARGLLDAWRGATTWEEGLRWLAEHQPERPIAEIQYWGHGHPGELMMDRVALDVRALEPGSSVRGLLERIRARLVGPEALWWFRTCLTFSGEKGHAFARAWVDFMGCRAAGHTFVLGPQQAGLHTLRPGEVPSWPLEEGAGEEKKWRWSAWLGAGRPNTVTCFTGKVPPEV